MKGTIVGMVTPHVLKVIDIANDAQKGVNVDWHLRDAVARSLADFSHQYNASDLLSAYVEALETAASMSVPLRADYRKALRDATAMATRAMRERERSGLT